VKKRKNEGKDKGQKSINEMMRKEDRTVQMRQGQSKLKKIHIFMLIKIESLLYFLCVSSGDLQNFG
jgi:hypothetical protein